MNHRPKLFRLADIFLLSAILLLTAGITAAILLPRRGGSAAVIRVDGEIVAALPLDRDTVYPVQSKWGSNTVTVKDGRVSVSDADCPDLVCVHTPALEKGSVGVIACLPHRLTVQVEDK